MPDNKANIVLHAYDGARQLVPSDFRWSARTRDGRTSQEQKDLHFLELAGPSQILAVDYFGNYGDLYTVFTTADGYDDMAWYPVRVSRSRPVELNMMLMPKDGHLQFANATWAKLSDTRRGVADIIRRGCKDDDDAAKKYSKVQE
jgi:hypothetical protein